MILEAILTLFQTLELEAELLEYTGELTYPYFVFSIDKLEIGTEDGMEVGNITIDGWSRESAEGLIEADEKLKNYTKYGVNVKTLNGIVTFQYGGSQMIPSNEAGLKRIEIILNYSGIEVQL